MTANHIAVGALLLLITLIYFGVKYHRTQKQRHLPPWGWVGLGTTLLAELGLFRGWTWMAIFFTPIVWTGYLLFIDAMVFSLRGRSRLAKAPQEFLSLAFWSFPLWLIFEAYNLRLENWTYVGLPDNLVVRSLGYVWSFATIWPAIFETADLVQALGLFPGAAKRRLRFNRISHISIAALGLLLVTLPVLVPYRVGRYLFGAVWLGFIFMLDPLNYRGKARSLLRDLESGQTATLFSFLVAGWVCGILWEFWNYWAGAKWLYIFPIWQGAKIFEMPLPGYLGFPVFALECLVMYEFLRTLKDQLLSPRQRPECRVVRSES